MASDALLRSPMRARGADVLISYLDEHEDAVSTKALVEAAGRRAVLVDGDISKSAHCRKIVDTAVFA
ncbi:hypothetical protein M2267_005635 [Ensifer sp. KUDG1]